MLHKNVYLYTHAYNIIHKHPCFVGKKEKMSLPNLPEGWSSKWSNACERISE